MRQLYDALLDAFPSEDELRKLVLFELDQNLRSIATGSTLSAMMLDLISWAEAHGRLERLIQGAQNTNPDNPRLRAFIGQLPANPTPVPTQAAPLVAPPSSPVAIPVALAVVSVPPPATE